MALSFLLLAGAGLFLQTLRNLQRVDLGFRSENLLLLEVDSSALGNRAPSGLELNHQLAERIKQLPGVRAVSYSDRGLFRFEGAFPVQVEESKSAGGSTGDAVGPGYFSTLGVPLLLGREIGPRDSAKAMRVCVINETFAQQFFGGRNPLGKRVAVGGDEQRRTLQVVGVAKDVRVYSLRARIDAKFYEAADQNGGVPFFEIRTTDNAENILTQVRRLVQTFDPDLTIQSAQSVDGLVDAQNAEPRLIAQLCTSFALLAVLLAGIGIYGVLSQSVARRTNEIGIRLALGANQNRVSGMILRETALLITSGMVLGLAVAAALARLLATQLSGPSATAPRWTMEQYEHVDSAVRLFGLDATDPLTLLAAAGFLGVLGMAAAYVPAMRAARGDPVNALRHG